MGKPERWIVIIIYLFVLNHISHTLFLVNSPNYFFLYYNYQLNS